MLTRRDLLTRSGLAALLFPTGARTGALAKKGDRMADYQALGSVKQTAAADTTGANTGNWTASFSRTSVKTGDSLPAISQAEVYHISISGAAALTPITVNSNNRQFSTTTTL